ncbi:MAG: SRPBCC family protein [Deltaproteobacteria bacterium]|nr:SRPBCC family protein [Deltaproteobacteria bacterium]
MHKLEREIILPARVETVWDFLATPRNLDRLTPPELSFEILGRVPREMHNGLLICYRIGIPFFGRWTWLTEIKHIVPGRSFVDEQRLGPYRFWYHSHRIEPLDDGRTRMRDQVDYCLPLGPLGELMHALLVKKMLQHIFDFRAEKLQEIFP